MNAPEPAPSGLTRRALLGRAFAVAAGTMLVGCGSAAGRQSAPTAVEQERAVARLEGMPVDVWRDPG